MSHEHNERRISQLERNCNPCFEEPVKYFRNGYAPSLILKRENSSFRVTSIYSKLNLDHDTPIVIGHHMMYDTNFNMKFEGKIEPRLPSNNNIRHVLLMGIGVPNEVLTQRDNLESPMTVSYVLNKPKVIMKISALNEFKNYKQERNIYIFLNKHQKFDFVRGIILKDMFPPCVVYWINNCTDEVKNAAIEHTVSFKDVRL